MLSAPIPLVYVILLHLIDGASPAANAKPLTTFVPHSDVYIPLPPGGIHAREPTGRDLYWIHNMEVREGNISRSFTGLLFEGDDPRVIAAAMCKEHRIGRCGYVESQLVAAERHAKRMGHIVLVAEVQVHYRNETKKRLYRHRARENTTDVTRWCDSLGVNATQCLALNRFVQERSTAGLGAILHVMNISVSTEPADQNHNSTATVVKEDPENRVIQIVIKIGDTPVDRARTTCLLRSVPASSCITLVGHLRRIAVAKCEGVGRDVETAVAEQATCAEGVGKCSTPKKRSDLAFLSNYRKWPLCVAALAEARVDPTLQQERDALQLETMQLSSETDFLPNAVARWRRFSKGDKVLGRGIGMEGEVPAESQGEGRLFNAVSARTNANSNAN